MLFNALFNKITTNNKAKSKYKKLLNSKGEHGVKELRV